MEWYCIAQTEHNWCKKFVLPKSSIQRITSLPPDWGNEATKRMNWLEWLLEKLADSSQSIGLRINLDKTKVMFSEHVIPGINPLNEFALEIVEKYFCSGLQLGKTTLRARLWEEYSWVWLLGNFGISLDVYTEKLENKKVFNQCVLPVMTQGCETWTNRIGSKI